MGKWYNEYSEKEKEKLDRETKEELDIIQLQKNLTILEIEDILENSNSSRVKRLAKMKLKEKKEPQDNSWRFRRY